MTKTLDRAAILAASAPDFEDFDLPGVGKVRLRQLTAGDLLGLPDGEKHGAALVARALVDADGKRLFGDDDLDVVTTMRTAVFSKLVARIMAMNFTAKDAAETVSKNSPRGPIGSSPSGSRKNSARRSKK